MDLKFDIYDRIFKYKYRSEYEIWIVNFSNKNVLFHYIDML